MYWTTMAKLLMGVAMGDFLAYYGFGPKKPAFPADL